MPTTSGSDHHNHIAEEQMSPLALKTYQTPQLRDLGKLSELTQAGGSNFNASDGPSSYAPVTS